MIPAKVISRRGRFCVSVCAWYLRNMSNVSESKPETAIGAMQPYDFWATPHGFGLSDEDAAAIADGSATQEQQDRAKFMLDAARQALICSQHGEPYPRPS